MISRIKIQNFKCFRNIVLNFKPLTILVGGNGVGKSTVIQTLLLYKYSVDSYFLFGSADGNQKIIKDEPFDVPLNGPFCLQLGQASDVISSQADSEKILFSFYNANGSELDFIYEIDEKFGNHLLRGTVAKIEQKSNFKEEIPLGGCLSYLNAERLGPRKGLMMPPNSKLEVGYQGEFTSFSIYKADIERVEIHPDLRLIESTRFSRQVEAWLATIIPNQEFDYKSIEDLGTISLKYKNSVLDTAFLLATNTGFGISYVLPIIVTGLLCSNLKNSVVIVENPEAHLNPLGQSRIGRFLAKLSLLGVQTIVETHSEHVVNGARIELALAQKADHMVAHYFMPKDEKVVVEELELNSVGEFAKWPLGFFDQEQKDLKELFLLKKGRRN